MLWFQEFESKIQEIANKNTTIVTPIYFDVTEKEEIKNMSESKRMKRYIGMFFEDIEEGKYLEAYSVLNEEFKNNYFPRLEDFEEYAKILVIQIH